MTRIGCHSTKPLADGYVGINVLGVVAIVVLRDDAVVVVVVVVVVVFAGWTGGTIVVVSALLMFASTVRAARVCRRAYLRLRRAMAAIIALPGTFSLWVKIEQSACGLILTGAVVIVNGKQLRSLSAAKGLTAGPGSLPDR